MKTETGVNLNRLTKQMEKISYLHREEIEEKHKSTREKTLKRLTENPLNIRIEKHATVYSTYIDEPTGVWLDLDCSVFRLTMLELANDYILDCIENDYGLNLKINTIKDFENHPALFCESENKAKVTFRDIVKEHMKEYNYSNIINKENKCACTYKNMATCGELKDECYIELV